MPEELRAMFTKVTKGALSGNAGEPARRISRSTASMSTRRKDEGVVGIPFLDAYIEKAALEYLDDAAKAGRAILHEHQLHEGAPAEPAASRLHT